MITLKTDVIDREIKTIMGRHARIKNELHEILTFQNVGGYHTEAHMQIVSQLVIYFIEMHEKITLVKEQLSPKERESLVIAAMFHDAGHVGRPDAFLNEVGASANIANALIVCDQFSGRFPQYDWPVIKDLIRGTQWPHLPLEELQTEGVYISTFARQLLRDADVLSSLRIDMTRLLLDGLPLEFATTSGTEVPYGAAQLANHVEFFSKYHPSTAYGVYYKGRHFPTAAHRWLGYLYNRDGGELADYEAIMKLHFPF